MLGKVYLDQNKIKGIELADKQAKEKIYNYYLEAYKKGVYNYIKEEKDYYGVPRMVPKYFSGGLGFEELVVTDTVSRTVLEEQPWVKMAENTMSPAMITAKVTLSGENEAMRTDLRTPEDLDRFQSEVRG